MQLTPKYPRYYILSRNKRYIHNGSDDKDEFVHSIQDKTLAEITLYSQLEHFTLKEFRQWDQHMQMRKILRLGEAYGYRDGVSSHEIPLIAYQKRPDWVDRVSWWWFDYKNIIIFTLGTAFSFWVGFSI